MEFSINKGINRAIEFKGIRAQYIAYLAIGLVGLLIVFAVAYIAGAPVYILLPITIAIGFVISTTITRYSHQYGEYGLMKRLALRQVPMAVVCRSRSTFCSLQRKEV